MESKLRGLALRSVDFVATYLVYSLTILLNFLEFCIIFLFFAYFYSV